MTDTQQLKMIASLGAAIGGSVGLCLWAIDKQMSIVEQNNPEDSALLAINFIGAGMGVGIMTALLFYLLCCYVGVAPNQFDVEKDATPYNTFT